MIRESAHRPPHVIAEELSRENDLDEAAELATELARSLEAQSAGAAEARLGSNPSITAPVSEGPPKGV